MRTITRILTVCFLSCFPVTSLASIITFDTGITVGQNSAQFDSDGDGIIDATFSTSSTYGFNMYGPGPNSLYINELGLEGNWPLSDVDLKVDFSNLAYDYLKFGYALNNDGPLPGVNWVKFYVYDANDVLLTSATSFGQITYTPAGYSTYFPEGEVSVTFSGPASYALFDFGSGYYRGAYIIDNFEGRFGSNEALPVPEPSTFLLLGAGLVGLALARKRMNQ